MHHMFSVQLSASELNNKYIKNHYFHEFPIHWYCPSLNHVDDECNREKEKIQSMTKPLKASKILHLARAWF